MITEMFQVQVAYSSNLCLTTYFQRLQKPAMIPQLQELKLFQTWTWVLFKLPVQPRRTSSWILMHSCFISFKGTEEKSAFRTHNRCADKKEDDPSYPSPQAHMVFQNELRFCQTPSPWHHPRTWAWLGSQQTLVCLASSCQSTLAAWWGANLAQEFGKRSISCQKHCSVACMMSSLAGRYYLMGYTFVIAIDHCLALA